MSLGVLHQRMTSYDQTPIKSTFPATLRTSYLTENLPYNVTNDVILPEPYRVPSLYRYEDNLRPRVGANPNRLSLRANKCFMFTVHKKNGRCLNSLIRIVIRIQSQVRLLTDKNIIRTAWRRKSNIKTLTDTYWWLCMHYVAISVFHGCNFKQVSSPLNPAMHTTKITGFFFLFFFFYILARNILSVALHSNQYSYGFFSLG